MVPFSKSPPKLTNRSFLCRSDRPIRSPSIIPPIISGVDGLPPATSIALRPCFVEEVRSACTGPDNGIADVMTLVNEELKAIDFTRTTGSDFACGESTSLYDVSPSGMRNGDPIADCYCCVSYPNHALLAVADGVGWGDPAKRAARCAVVGSISHLHVALKGGTFACRSDGP